MLLIRLWGPFTLYQGYFRGIFAFVRRGQPSLNEVYRRFNLLASGALPLGRSATAPAATVVLFMIAGKRNWL